MTTEQEKAAAGEPVLQAIDLKRHYAVDGGFLKPAKTVKALDGVSFSLQAGRTPQTLFDKLKSFLTDYEILELTYITSLYDMHAVMSRALRTEFDDVPEAMTEVPAPADPPPGVSVGPNPPS